MQKSKDIRKGEIKAVALNDYLSSIVNSITNARKNADIQSIEIAKDYSNDKYMKHLSIPRVKIKDIKLNIPFAIDSFGDENKTGKKNDKNFILSQILSDTKEYFGEDKIPDEVDYFIKKEIFLNFDKNTKSRRYLNSLSKNIADGVVKAIDNSEYSEEILGVVKERIAPEVLSLSTKKTKKSRKKNREEISLTHNLNDSSISNVKLSDVKKDFKNFLQSRLDDKVFLQNNDKEIGQTNVIAHSHLLKDLPQDSLVRIEATIVEESLEWSYEDGDNGRVVRRLLPE